MNLKGVLLVRAMVKVLEKEDLRIVVSCAFFSTSIV